MGTERIRGAMLLPAVLFLASCTGVGSQESDVPFEPIIVRQSGPQVHEVVLKEDIGTPEPFVLGEWLTVDLGVGGYRSFSFSVQSEEKYVLEVETEDWRSPAFKILGETDLAVYAVLMEGNNFLQENRNIRRTITLYPGLTYVLVVFTINDEGGVLQVRVRERGF